MIDMLERAARAVWATSEPWIGEPPPFELGASNTAANAKERAHCFTIAREAMLAALDPEDADAIDDVARHINPLAFDHPLQPPWGEVQLQAQIAAARGVAKNAIVALRACIAKAPDTEAKDG